MASDSDTSDVEVEDAPPNTWDDLSWWVNSSGRAQRGLVGGYTRVRPHEKCRLDRTAAKAAAAAAARPSTGGRQATLLAHARPVRWTAVSMALSTDAIETIVLRLMAQSDARTLRALAVVNRECAAVVRDTLGNACRKLQDRAWAFCEAQDARHDMGYDDEEAMSDAQLDAVVAVEERRLQALDAYEICMLEAGIPEPRVRALVRKPEARWFHGSTHGVSGTYRRDASCAAAGRRATRAFGRGRWRCSPAASARTRTVRRCTRRG